MRMRISFSLRLIFLMMLSSPMISEGGKAAEQRRGQGERNGRTGESKAAASRAEQTDSRVMATSLTPVFSFAAIVLVSSSWAASPQPPRPFCILGPVFLYPLAKIQDLGLACNIFVQEVETLLDQGQTKPS